MINNFFSLKTIAFLNKKNFTFSLCFLFIFGLFSCSNNEATPSISGKWKLCYYKYVYSGTTGQEPKDIERSVTVTFSDDGTNGTMSGQTIEHDFSAIYTLENGQIDVDSLAASGTDELRWGQKFVEALVDADTYILKRKKMCIYYSNSREYMVSKKQ